MKWMRSLRKAIYIPEKCRIFHHFSVFNQSAYPDFYFMLKEQIFYFIEYLASYLEKIFLNGIYLALIPG